MNWAFQDLCFWGHIFIEVSSFSGQVVILGVSQAIRCFIAVILVLVLPHWGLLGFAMAQLSSSICYAAMYYLYFAHYVTSQVKKDDGDTFPFQAVQDFFPQAVEGKVKCNIIRMEKVCCELCFWLGGLLVCLFVW